MQTAEAQQEQEPTQKAQPLKQRQLLAGLQSAATLPVYNHTGLTGPDLGSEQ